MCLWPQRFVTDARCPSMVTTYAPQTSGGPCTHHTAFKTALSQPCATSMGYRTHTSKRAHSTSMSVHISQTPYGPGYTIPTACTRGKEGRPRCVQTHHLQLYKHSSRQRSHKHIRHEHAGTSKAKVPRNFISLHSSQLISASVKNPSCTAHSLPYTFKCEKEKC